MTLTDIKIQSQRRLDTDNSKPTISIVSPAKNEALNLPLVFAGLDRDFHEAILVDDGSTDVDATGRVQGHPEGSGQ